MKGASLIAPFGLRMPEDLKGKIAERAKSNGRSMNAEIVQILQDAVDAKGKAAASFAGIDVQEMHRILEKVIEESLARKK
ncbi:Arc family DNA-binding protein [Citrobacter freundii]|uniref:Arc family DNA-binding protein n=1 Tax=Citrobacter freundii TaxID=546 RepID=UPI0034D74FC1